MVAVSNFQFLEGNKSRANSKYLEFEMRDQETFSIARVRYETQARLRRAKFRYERKRLLSGAGPLSHITYLNYD